LAEAGVQITEQLGMDSNITLTTPLNTALEGAEFVGIFLNTILGTIIAFLGILSV
jgi:alpha-galactosidase/6-phospho-beta-glucosidase family protein